MKKLNKSFFVKLFVAFLLIQCLGFFHVNPMQVFAADSTEYVATWEEWAGENGVSTTYGEYTWNQVASAIDQVLDAGEALFTAGDYEGARAAVSDAYYGFYETTGMERYTNGISGARVSEVELQFKTARKIAKAMNETGEGSYEEYETEVEELRSMLHSDANQFDGVSEDTASDSTDDSDASSTETVESSTSAATITFSACFLIMLREGFEAILIVGAILAYLKKSSGNDKAKEKKFTVPVYVGCVAGVGLSFVLAWLLTLLKLANTASQEVIEGVTALIAVCVLYYVSNWMLSKSESDAWNAYIKNKTKASTEKGSTFALAFTAFLAVFREGAEVVLFYQPYMSTDNRSSAWAGFAIGCLALVVVYLLIRFMSLRIPLKPFFTGTSVLMFIMSISFLGAGIKELMEGDVITMTSPAWLQWIPYNDALDVLGIYPTLQTLIPQLVLLVVTVVIFAKTTKKNNAIHAEAEARRAKEREIEAAKEAERKALEFKKSVLMIYMEAKEAESAGKLEELLKSCEATEITKVSD